MTDLTDRMRTCAAYILSMKPDPELEGLARYIMDAANLMVEASNALDDAKPPLGEPPKWRSHAQGCKTLVTNDENDCDCREKPMEIIPPSPAWKTDAPPPPTGRTEAAGQRRIGTCPKCDSRAAKTVHIKDRQLMLSCPVCAAEWDYKPPGEWR